MSKYRIYAGLGGGFGGATFQGIYECEDENAATQIAYDLAVEEYQSYEGLHGLQDYEDVREEYIEQNGEEPDEDILNEYYMEEIGRWIDYWVEETTDEDEGEDE